MASGGQYRDDDDDDAMLIPAKEYHDEPVVTHQPDQYQQHQMPPAYTPPHSHPPGGMVHMGNMASGYPHPQHPGGMVPMGPYPPPQPQHNMQHHTTVIINQQGVVDRGPKVWSSTMCSCCDDMGSCMLGWCCPCVLASQIAMDMGEDCCVPWCVPGWLIVLRAKLRAERNISGTVMGDCCDVCCCHWCVMCQMARELKFIRNSYRPQQ